jgi:hypothetical protein
VSHAQELPTYDEDCELVAAAVAAVACVRTELGPFLAAAIPEGKGEFERWRVEDFEVCRAARATCLAGGERSIFGGGEGVEIGENEENGEQEQRKLNEPRRFPGMNSSTARGAWLRAYKAVVVVDCRLSVTELGDSVFSPADSRRWAMWGSEVGFKGFARATNHRAGISLNVLVLAST